MIYLLAWILLGAVNAVMMCRYFDNKYPLSAGEGNWLLIMVGLIGGPISLFTGALYISVRGGWEYVRGAR